MSGGALGGPDYPDAMRRTLPSIVPAVSALALVGALLVGCGQENDDDVAADPSGETAPAEESEEGAEEPADEGEAGDTGTLPDWAPEIVTEGDDVVGLDFTDIAPLSDELLVQVVEEGDGAPVEAGQSITADYFGQLPDAEEPFDESFSGQPFTAPIGAGQLIQGWDEGLVGVPVGSRVIMSVPPELGYGEGGAPPTIPGGATLFFVIDIIDAA